VVWRDTPKIYPYLFFPVAITASEIEEIFALSASSDAAPTSTSIANTATENGESFALSASSDAAPTSNQVEIVVDVATATTTAESACNRLGDYLRNEFNRQIAREMADQFVVPYPKASFYEGCAPDPQGRVFSAYLAFRNPTAIERLRSALMKDNSDLAETHTIKLSSRPDSILLEMREKPVASAAASELELFRQAHPFPTKEQVDADLESATAPTFKEGLTASKTYTMAATFEQAKKVFGRYGRKACLTKDQPKDSRLCTVRVFKEDRSGFESKARESGESAGPKEAKRGGPGGPKGGKRGGGGGAAI
jgi:hypothetical protein